MRSNILKTTAALIQKRVIPILECKAYGAGITRQTLAQHAQVQLDKYLSNLRNI